MDSAERIAEQHLRHRGFINIVHEPHGKVPPDFLVDGRIAVEVRRLNENERGRSEAQGLDATELPMLRAVDQWLDSFGPPVRQSWWVRLAYKRPLPKMKQLKKVTLQFLQAAVANPPSGREKLKVADDFEIELIPRKSAGTATFALAVMRDDDSGGWVLEEVERNLRLCIDDKTKKIAAVRSRYPEWWLVLIDQIAFGVAEFDRETFRRELVVSHDWDRLVLVSPADPTHYFEP